MGAVDKVKQERILSRVLPDGMLETIRKGDTVVFAVYEREKGAAYEIDDFFPWLPCGDDIVTKRKGMLKVPDGWEEYGTPEELADEVLAFVRRYLDISELDEKICVYYILMTWLFGRQNEIPYLCFRGDYSAGKTRALKIVGMLCYHPILTSSVTTAALYYMADMYAPTLLMDEFNLQFSDNDSEIVRMLNSGYSADTCAIRIVGEGTKHPETYDVFCPKIIANKHPFDDPALESRCLIIDMYPTSRDDIPISLPSGYEDEMKELQRKLLQFRFDWYWALDWDASEKMNEPKMRKYPPRLRQIIAGFKGLFSILPNAEDEIDRYMESYDRQQLRQRESSNDGMIVYSLLLAIKEEETWVEDNKVSLSGDKVSLDDIWITSKTVADCYQRTYGDMISNQKVAVRLRGLKITTEAPAKHPIRNRAERRLLLKIEALQDLSERYLTPESREELVTRVTRVTRVTGPGGVVCNNFARQDYVNELQDPPLSYACKPCNACNWGENGGVSTNADEETVIFQCEECGKDEELVNIRELNGRELCPECYDKLHVAYLERKGAKVGGNV